MIEGYQGHLEKYLLFALSLQNGNPFLIFVLGTKNELRLNSHVIIALYGLYT